MLKLILVFKELFFLLLIKLMIVTIKFRLSRFGDILLFLQLMPLAILFFVIEFSVHSLSLFFYSSETNDEIT